MADNVDDLLRRRDELATQKREIESQLNADKSEMLEERAELIDRGLNLREATIRATAGGDPDWRRRAVGALKHVEKELAAVKQKLRAVAPRGPRKRKALVFRGSAEELAAFLDTIPGQIYALTTVARNETVIVCSDDDGS